MKILSLYIILFSIIPFGNTGKLFVKVTGIDKRIEGRIIVTLCRTENWRDKKNNISELIFTEYEDSLTVEFDGIEFGDDYVVKVLHDEDGDGEMDFKFFPPGPSEGIGVSRNARGLFGPPDYEDVRFKVNKSITNIEIEMYY